MSASPDIKSKKPNYTVKHIEPVMAGPDFQARVFTLAQSERVPWHCHSEVTDHYFVLHGALTIETRKPDERHVIEAGSRYRIEPGTIHTVSNQESADCTYLLLDGVGKYDWLKA